MNSVVLFALVLGGCSGLLDIETPAYRSKADAGQEQVDTVTAPPQDTEDAGGIISPVSDGGVTADSDGTAHEAGTGADGNAGGCSSLTIHDDGEGQLWTDCTPLGTYDVIEAMAACQAFAQDRWTCEDEGPAASDDAGYPLTDAGYGLACPFVHLVRVFAVDRAYGWVYQGWSKGSVILSIPGMTEFDCGGGSTTPVWR